ETGKLEIVDMYMSQLNPSAHLTEDLFKSNIAFFIILNFRKYSLDEKMKYSDSWTNEEWGYARLGDLFSSRMPSELTQEYSKLNNKANSYVSSYNIIMGNLLDANKECLFPADLKLISHWGLRDEIKAQYANSDGFEKQKLIYEVMKRVVNQTIPDLVINNVDYQWAPEENKVYKDGVEGEVCHESDVRYKHLHGLFHSLRKGDKYYPGYSSFIQRKFELEREMSEKGVIKLFEKLMLSPQVGKVTKLISKRLNRPLHPVDIWYDGFKTRSKISEKKLDDIVSKKYPNVEAFQADLPNILSIIGLDDVQSEFVSSRVVVDPSRGAGHAWGAQMKSEKSHLRTRFDANGMNYKGFNIAIHELGHNTEQVFSLQKVEPYFIHGIPSTAFTEAFAFVFQSRDMKVLGLESGDADQEYLRVLDLFWNTFEMMGVAVMDIRVWNWLYKNPEASASELKDQVLKAAKDVWNEFYSEHFQIKDQAILAIYSHMIVVPLYLADYPIGRIISYQIEKYLEGKKLGDEMERMCTVGSISPQSWMKKAVGSKISVDPLLVDVSKALESLRE
ncbi:hypothetical protein KAJ27_25510, partial [bacterium]|nr:hypothetical protein [bacterium]